MIFETIKELRESHNLTQQEVSDGIKVNLSTYKNYEYGRREPDLDTVLKIAIFYNVSADYLLGRPEAKAPEDPVDVFAKNADLKELEEILIKKYLTLSDKQRESVLDFMRNAIKEEEERKKAIKEDKTVEELEEEYKKTVLKSALKKDFTALNTTDGMTDKAVNNT